MKKWKKIKRFLCLSLRLQAKPETIIDPVPDNLIINEIKGIKDEYTLFRIKNYTVYCVPALFIPNILRELGRLREITFRDVGEGSNKSLDISEYDYYYHHMFIWDEQQERIAGAYRIGKGKEILRQYGAEGFYISSLFRIDAQFTSYLDESLELGRSFIVKEYQRKPLPLFLLWKGILFFLLKNPEYRYLIGPVSISNSYQVISKDLMVKFILAHHYNGDLARYIRPRKSYKFKNKSTDLDSMIEIMDNDLGKLDKTIAGLDPIIPGIPVLLKKYLKQNAKIIGFNLDSEFNDCLDGLIVLDVNDVPENTIESLSG